MSGLYSTHFSAAFDLKYVIRHYKKTLAIYSYIWDSLSLSTFGPLYHCDIVMARGLTQKRFIKYYDIKYKGLVLYNCIL